MNPSAIPTIQPASTGASDFGDYSNWAQGEMSKGFTADQLKQTLAQSGIQLAQPQATQTPAAAPHGGGGGSWWHSLIPAAGGVLGGLVGGLAGGVGAVGGATGGAALGQMLENKLEGKGVVQGNVASSAIQNGVGEVVGLGAGKLVGKLGEGLVRAGAKAGEKTAQEALEKTAANVALDDAKATKLNYGGIHDSVQNQMGLGPSQKFVQGMGLDPTNPYDMQKLAGGVEPLNNVYDRALSGALPVKTSGLERFFGVNPTTQATQGLSKEEVALLKKQNYTDEAIAKMSPSGTQKLDAPTSYDNLDPNSPVSQALADFNKARKAEPNAALPSDMNATDVRKLQQAVGRQIGNTRSIINNAALNGQYNAEAAGHLNTLEDMYGQLGSKIKTKEVNKAVQGYQVTDADRQGLVEKFGEKMGNHIADTVNNAKTADDLLGPMQDLTKMNQLSGMAINDIENVTASPRAEARVKFKNNNGVAPSSTSTKTSSALDMAVAGAQAVKSPASTVIAVGKRLHEAGMTPKIAEGMGNILKRTAPLAAPAAVLNSNIPNIAAGMQGSAVPANQEGGAAMQPAGQTPATQAPNPINSTLDSLLFSLSQPGASLTPGYASMVSGASALAPTVQNNQLAAQTISGLAPTFENAGGAQGLGGGLLSSLLAKIPGTAANTYQNQQSAAAAQLAKVLGISPEAAMALFPQLGQTEQVAAPQQAATTGLVGSLTGQ